MRGREADWRLDRLARCEYPVADVCDRLARIKLDPRAELLTLGREVNKLGALMADDLTGISNNDRKLVNEPHVDGFAPNPDINMLVTWRGVSAST